MLYHYNYVITISVQNDESLRGYRYSSIQMRGQSESRVRKTEEMRFKTTAEDERREKERGER